MLQVRKKSAKVREMEEAEELEKLERKAWKKEQKSGVKRHSKSGSLSPVKAAQSTGSTVVKTTPPHASSPVKAAPSPVKAAPSVENTTVPIKLKLNLSDLPTPKKVRKATVSDSSKVKVTSDVINYMYTYIHMYCMHPSTHTYVHMHCTHPFIYLNLLGTSKIID